MAIDAIINDVKPLAIPTAELNRSGALDTEKTKKAAEDFEAIFINYMFKTMRESISKSGLLDGGKAEEMYTAMMDEELSKAIAHRGGIGLGSILLKELNMRGDSSQPDEGFLDKVSKITQAKPYSQMPEESANDNEAGQTPKFKSPISGVLSSKYGYRHDPFKQDVKFHHGIDIAAKEGTEVYPSASGVVIFSGWKDGYGNMVEIRHNNGYVTRYGHNAKNLVKEGDNVDLGTQIAEVGSTGRSTGAHLHFEIRKDGVAQNPADFMSIG